MHGTKSAGIGGCTKNKLALPENGGAWVIADGASRYIALADVRAPDVVPLPNATAITSA
jgi:hypothetical protein